MAINDRGMRLSTRGLSLTGEQVVKVENSRGRDEIFVLVSDTVVESYTYDPLSDNGFTANGSWGNFKAQALAMYGEPLDNIMEIAGGVDTLKVRLDNGDCYIGKRTYGGAFIISPPLKNIARITKNDEYAVAVPYKYYKAGGGTTPLMALLEGDILAVFEGKDTDHKVTVAQAIASTNGFSVGVVGSLTVFSQNGSLKVITPNDGTVAITGYGTIVREVDATKDIKIGTHIPTNGNVVVDHSSEFSADHYAYINAGHRSDYKNGWSGVGHVGYIVDLGEYAYMNVPISGENVVGEPPLVPTQKLNDTIDFVIVGGILKKVEGTTLTNMPKFADDGVPLITHIYHTDMSQEVVMVAGNETVEPFSVNGYFFGYGADHLEDVDLATLPIAT